MVPKGGFEPHSRFCVTYVLPKAFRVSLAYL